MDTNEARQKREGVESTTLVMRLDGKTEYLSYAVGDQEQNLQLREFLKREAGVFTTEAKKPAHIEIMEQQELVGYEPASDTGHFRFYPKGALMKDLLSDLAEDVAIRQIGATKIETPLIYRNEGAVKEQAASFHESDYHMQEDGRELILRFAGDFGLFNMIKDVRAGEKQLPLRLYEISPSFRREKRGSCSGLKRLRGFTMPDIHCFCEDFEQGMEEFARLHRFYDKFLRDSGLEFGLGFRTTKDFLAQNPEFILDRLKDSKQDALVEVLDSMKHYWVLKNEFQYIDTSRDNIQLSTVQLDISDAARYGLTYTASNGSKKPFTIVHSSMGSIERIMGAILEERAREMISGVKPSFPYWLSPTQLRIIPVDDRHVQIANNIAESLSNVRVDIDDRKESLGKKVRSAEKEWVPLYTVVGDIEQASNNYMLKARGSELSNLNGERFGLEGLQGVLSSAQENHPFRNSYLNRNVSRQLRFGSGY